MKAYSFLNTVVLINGVPLTNWADGDDAISIKRRTDMATDKVGADGRMAVAISADHSGEVTFKLMQTSPSNRYLNLLHTAQQNGPDTFLPVQVMFLDTHRQDRGVGTVGYIKKLPDVSRGAGINTQEWTLVVEDLQMAFGNPAFALEFGG